MISILNFSASILVVLLLLSTEIGDTVECGEIDDEVGVVTKTGVMCTKAINRTQITTGSSDP